MLYRILEAIDARHNFPRADAHCDIPCKIYDPMPAQIAALTVIRMVDMLKELEQKGQMGLDEHNTFSRLVAQKEEHAEKVKHEIRVIWGDYYKEPQFQKVPNAHDLVHNIMLAGSKCKQTVDRDAAVKLLGLVNEFAEGFWKTKDVDTYRATCPYPPNEETVYPKLGG